MAVTDVINEQFAIEGKPSNEFEIGYDDAIHDVLQYLETHDVSIDIGSNDELRDLLDDIEHKFYDEYNSEGYNSFVIELVEYLNEEYIT